MQRRSWLQQAGAWAAGTAAITARANPSNPPPVVLGVIGISFHAVVGAVIKQLLEGLGQVTRVVNAPHDEMFRRLGAGEVDLLVTAWMPDTHAHLFNPLGGRIERIAAVYRDARLFWAVPAYVDGSVASIADLSRPDVIARMDKTIMSIGPSAGLSVQSGAALVRYGLDAVGYRLRPGATDAWVSNFREGVRAQRWLVMPLWQPQFLNRTHDIRELADPLGAMGGRDEAVVVASRAFLERANTRVLSAVQRVDIGVDGVTDMDLAVNVDGLSADAAAAAWMSRHAQKVRSWSN